MSQLHFNVILISFVIILKFKNGKSDTFNGICFYNNLKTPLPVRYLFIQLVDKYGNNLTEASVEKFINVDLVSVKITKDNESQCRFRHELLNNFDGTFVFRLRILVACKQLQIHFLSPQNETLCGGPFIIDEVELLNPEECYCEGKSKPTVDEWINSFCPAETDAYKQLFEDLKNFETIDFEKTMQKVEKRWGHPDQSKAAAICRYKLSNNEVSKHCYGEYTGFSMFSDEILTSLAKKMQLPTMEFIQNLGDWPLEFENPKDNGSGVAIISWCGSKDTFDIIVPTYELVEATLKSMDTIARDMQNIKGRQFIPWAKKLNKAVFRGRDSNEFRLKVAKLALERPEILDGGITRYFFFDETLNPKPVEHRPFNEFFKYRYIVSIDGTVAAYRLPYLLGGNSVVLKQDSKFYENFYTHIKPNVHFIPFNEDNFVGTLEYIQTLTDMNEMTAAARAIAREYLQPLNIFCYYATFLQEYSKLFKSATSQKFLDEVMEPLNLSTLTASQTETFCNCKRTSSNTDEL